MNFVLGHYEATKVLIENGCNVNAKDFLEYTAIHLAAMHGNFDDYYA